VSASETRTRIASVLVLVGLGAFLALHVAGAIAYPGGTFCDEQATRYQVMGNFVCDLTQPRTLRGADNAVSARLATAAFAFLAVAFAPFWWLVGGLLGRWSGRLVRVLGVVSALATIILARTPSGRWPLLHVTMVFTASIPGLVAAIAGSIGLLRARRIGVGLLGAATLLAGFADAAAYGHAVAAGVHCTPYLAPLQKVAAFGMLAWMILIATDGLRRPARGGVDFRR
jgi:hypothetical protein